MSFLLKRDRMIKSYWGNIDINIYYHGELTYNSGYYLCLLYLHKVELA